MVSIFKIIRTTSALLFVIFALNRVWAATAELSLLNGNNKHTITAKTGTTSYPFIVLDENEKAFITTGAAVLLTGKKAFLEVSAATTLSVLYCMARETDIFFRERSPLMATALQITHLIIHKNHSTGVIRMWSNGIAPAIYNAYIEARTSASLGGRDEVTIPDMDLHSETLTINSVTYGLHAKRGI